MVTGTAVQGPGMRGAGTAFGSGWISGVLSAALGAIGFAAVLCFHLPSLLTVPELRTLYPLPR